MSRKEELELLISNGIIKDIAKIIIKYANPLLSEINCHRCLKESKIGKLQMFEEDKQYEMSYKNPDVGTQTWPIDYDYNCLVCDTCGSYYMLCAICCNLDNRDDPELKSLYKNQDTDPPVHLCQFLGGYTHREIDGGIIQTDENVKYSVENQNICYANLKDLNHYLDGSDLTGPDGGYGVDWKCNNCDYMFSVSDK